MFSRIGHEGRAGLNFKNEWNRNVPRKFLLNNPKSRNSGAVGVDRTTSKQRHPLRSKSNKFKDKKFFVPFPVHLNKNLSKETKVHYLKSKLLAGLHVTHSEIMTVANGGTKSKNRVRFSNVYTFSNDTFEGPKGFGRVPLYVHKGIVGMPSPHRPAPLTNSFGTPNELRVSLTGEETQETHQRYRFFVDMQGFTDEEITLTMQGQTITITGQRKMKDHNASKTCSETIDLPPDLQADNLRAVRDCFGTVILEECWKF